MTIPGKKPLRLWPGVVLVILQWLIRIGILAVYPEGTLYAVLGGLAGGLAIVVWWVFFSRAAWLERLGAVVLMIIGLYATSRVTDISIAMGGQGFLFYILAIPVLSLAFVMWAVATRHFSDGLRRATMIAAILLACGVWTLVRTGGLTADFDSDLHWRWTKTPEERLLARSGSAQSASAPTAPQAAPEATKTAEKPVDKGLDAKSDNKPTVPPLNVPGGVPAPTATDVDWPAFRGPHRDSIIRGVRIKTDWNASPPVALWRRPVGPGWSSFAVCGGFLYTQEQRGSDELVACYNLATGEPVWTHRDAARFWESNGGPGPRGTPALANGRVYSLGATGILNALNAGDGSIVWSRDAASDAGIKVPQWGFASSPLVVDSLVIVAVAGRLAAYDLVTGAPRWFGPSRGESYSSPHLMTVDGVEQVLLLSETGATSVAPADGKVLWQNPWGFSIVQPALTADGNLLISAINISGGVGIRRVAVTHESGEWTVEERWTSRGLKPYFNDFVIHNGHAFGFDGSILACIDLKDGNRKWKGGRYGNGQIVLLAEQDLLLVLSEEGELALVRATDDQFTELARSPAIEGKTWNHPVLVGDVLLVRNGQEMAAFRLRLAGR
jgi:outer membrane protein assembly factor BamB